MLVQQRTARKTRGFTLTEAAIVLGIVGLILGAIWVAAASVYNNLRVKQTSEALLQTSQAVRSLHATSTIVDPAITATMVAQAGGIPSDMVTKSAAGAVTAVTDVWGGAVNVIAASTGTPAIAGDSYTINFASVPQAACIDLLVRNAGSGRDSGMVRAGVGAGAAAGLDLTTQATGVTTTQALAQCTATGTAGNTVSFTFRLRSS